MSMKKLSDLLNTGSQGGRDTQWFVPQNTKPVGLTQPQFSPLSTNNLTSGPARNPSYNSIPGVQNMFYHPTTTKNQIEPLNQTSIFQLPVKKNQPDLNSLFQGSRYSNAETNPTFNYSQMEGNNVSNSVHSLVSQLQNQLNTQPRNLEELLQKSFSTGPSNSLLLSPYMGGNNHTSHMQPSMGNDLNSLLAPLTLLETSLQNNNLMASQTHKNHLNEAANKTLVLQLAQILKEESESKIKSAIAELILKFKALGLLSNLSGNDMMDLQSLITNSEQQQQQQQQPQPSLFQQFQPTHQEVHHPQQQSLFSLPCGLPLASQESIFKPQSNKVNATRRELFAMNEVPLIRQQTNENFQGSLFQGGLFQNNQNSILSGPLSGFSASPSNGLENEMNSLNLSVNMSQSLFGGHGMTTISAPEKMEDLAALDLECFLKDKIPSGEELPGVYNKYERIHKILKYKNKIGKWRRQHPVKRVFKGRSMVAVKKPRIKGKFVTPEEYQQYLNPNCKKEHDGFVKAEYY